MLKRFDLYFTDACKALALAVLGLTLNGMSILAAPATSLLWFVPRNQPPIPAPDFMELFKPDAPWSHGATHVQVFKLYPQFLERASDQDLKTVIEGCKQRHIALGAELGMVDYTDKSLCGNSNPNYGHIEGQGGGNVWVGLDRIKKLGGDLRYIGMDEPLWFGHVVTAAENSGAGEAQIEAIARNVAKQVATARRYFPNVVVGDIEPVVANRKGYLDALKGWVKAYKAATGEPLAFFHCDIAWTGNEWQEPLAEVSRLMRANHIPFGVIYNGEGKTGVEWTASAEQRLIDVESNPALIPDHVIIQSWEAQPLYALPETQPGTLTYLLNRYLAAQTEIQAAKTLHGFEGSLLAHGRPVAHALISAYEIDDGTLNLTSTASRTGTVPADAVSATVGLRVNIECGNVSDKSADVFLGEARYLDEKTKETVCRKAAPSEHVVVQKGEKVARDSGKFSVTGGNMYTFSVPMRVPYSSRDSGFVDLVFLDKAGKEVTRLRIPLEPGQRCIGVGKTDSTGKFSFPAAAGTKQPIVRFDFAGNESLRMTSKMLQ